MCDQWMPALQLPLTFEQFQQLPRNAAYQYEYHDGIASLSPRAKVYHALLDLAAFAPNSADVASSTTTLRRVWQRDLATLVPVFGEAFRNLQPFASLDDAVLDQAAHACLTKTWTGGDGPWVRLASFVALRDGQPVGAILISLVPEVDPTDWNAFAWSEPPPSDLLKQRRGQPHVTWIFVSPWEKGAGVGTTLLGASVKVLRKLGYRSLLSTFFSANESSLLWHWRAGFQLLPHPGSRRRLRNWMLDLPGENKP